jgi:hypothetical protein
MSCQHNGALKSQNSRKSSKNSRKSSISSQISKDIHNNLSLNTTTMATLTTITRFAAQSLSRTNTPAQARSLSSQGAVAIEKLRSALEEYRIQK